MTPLKLCEYILATGAGLTGCAVMFGICTLVYLYFVGLLNSKKP